MVTGLVLSRSVGRSLHGHVGSTSLCSLSPSLVCQTTYVPRYAAQRINRLCIIMRCISQIVSQVSGETDSQTDRHALSRIPILSLFGFLFVYAFFPCV